MHRLAFRFVVLATVGWGLMMALVLPAMAATDRVAPPVPRNFQAAVVSGDAAVTLTWEASTDASGIKAYRIERSLDQAAWKLVTDSVTELSYRDTGTGFGLHYFYRLSAVDTAGNSSGWATSDVSTDDVDTGAGVSTEVNLTSSDKLATVRLPAGAAVSDLSCALNGLRDVNGKKVGTTDQPVVVGPYELACRTTAGSIVTEYKQKAVWTLNLKDNLKKLKDPVVYAYDAENNVTQLKDAEYDSKTQVMRVAAPPNSIVVVQASVPRGISPNLVAIILVVIGIVVGIVVLAVNRKKKLDYDDYLRSKYYDL